MKSKKEFCRNWKLYVITEESALKSRSLEEVVAESIKGGADVVQLRDKRCSDDEMLAKAKKLLEVTQKYSVPLIINDRVEVCRLSGADGLHLGQEDGGLREIRALLGERVILGRSTHSPEQALAAESEGFDYIGVGPVFQTPTKPDYSPVGLDLVEFASKNIRIPFVAIGGINRYNVAAVCKAGARCVAVVRAVMADEDPKAAAQNILGEMK